MQTARRRLHDPGVRAEAFRQLAALYAKAGRITSADLGGDLLSAKAEKCGECQDCLDAAAGLTRVLENMKS